MQSSTEYKPNLSRGILILGQPGTGKTTTALQVAPSPSWIADLDNNLSGAHRIVKTPFYYDTIDEEPNPQLRFGRFNQKLQEASTSTEIKANILDSFSKFSDYLLDDILRQQGRSVLQLQDWGVFLNVFKRIIVQLRSTRKMFIATAHIKSEKDEISGIVRFLPALPGQIQNIIGALFSDVWLCEVQEKAGEHKFLVRTMPNVWYPLKNSLGLPAVTDVATIRAALEKENK